MGLNSESEDIWGSDESSCYGLEESMEIRKLRKVHHSRGYVDGISSAKEENLQDGFDESFPVGADLGFSVGQLIGRLQILDYLHGSKNAEIREMFRQAKEELCIRNVLAKKHFNDHFDRLPLLTELLEKWINRIEKVESEFLQ